MNLFDGRLVSAPKVYKCAGGCGKLMLQKGAYCMPCYTEKKELDRQAQEDSDAYKYKT